jgi:dTDP-4-amino-4,6-dideoxygalactose transaminase
MAELTPGPFVVPFNRPSTARRGLEFVADTLRSGHLAGDGPFSSLCETRLAEIIGAPVVLLTTSCTDALEMAALLLDLRPGDEVIVPSFTFPSTALAFHLRGAVPVFCDIRSDTLNLDEQALPALFTDRTRAVVVMHYAGVACAMESIIDLCRSRGVALVEDNAHGLFGLYNGKPLGSFGVFATQSFHETKNLTCGEGGAIVVNDSSYIERAKVVREKGTNRDQFRRGQVDKYTWVDVGSSFLPSDVSAALLWAQLEEASEIQAKRRHIWDRYGELLHGWATDAGARLPFVPGGARHSYHMYHVIFDTHEEQRRIRLHLLNRAILAVTHYVPLHSSPFGRSVGRGECPTSERISATLLRLPFYSDMTDAEMDLVVDALVEASS